MEECILGVGGVFKNSVPPWAPSCVMKFLSFLRFLHFRSSQYQGNDLETINNLCASTLCSGFPNFPNERPIIIKQKQRKCGYCMSGKHNTGLRHIHSTTCHNLEKASYYLLVIYPITTHWYSYHKIIFTDLQFTDLRIYVFPVYLQNWCIVCHSYENLCFGGCHDTVIKLLR